MGREISSQEVLCEDTFQHRLRSETSLVMQWFREGAFNPASPAFSGLELEAWLIDVDCFPAERNLEFLERLNDPAMVPELAAFNFEFNSEPRALSCRCFSDFEDELNTHWKQARTTAQEIGLRPMMIGIPPTLREGHLSLDTITPSERYRLLNERLFQLRGGKPLCVDIEGRDQLSLIQDHLMTEAACTSLQVHLMTSEENAVRNYNAMQVASAAIVAVSANSPFLYGRRLWEETRIPAFESAVNLPGPRGVDGRHASRVTFGERYLRSSLMELFIENLDTYIPFLPMVSQSEREELVHLKLQHGTIWRWNRPIFHASPGEAPHLRIENRVMAAGPTVVDVVANTAFAIGLTLHLAQEDGLEERLPFELA
ncbi:glutamate-cysteine ligase family protein [Maricaulis sp.]|uniref:glutamate-cysteine ligase family protein n=1 Tax=Maricaulis sp. TaxID=1486257 RepID=UPI001B08B0F5|nr:glutamate-cysteine ligase family protein [Maricaulis sp.]MBO6796981.1 glutamate--cysteine ligase [Maricaulis sp.]